MSPVEAEVREWLRKAHNDRRTADAALAQTPPITDTAAFHLQQVAEKMLKALLVARSAPFERIHDLGRLLEVCIGIEASFSLWKPRLVPLSAYAVRFRYPGPNDPTLQEVQAAASVVDDLIQFVLPQLPSASASGVF
jgi:HEPN domain-containing protein